MQKIMLDAQYLLEKETAHEYLKEKLALSDYYGKNLDALYDCLTELVDVEIYIDTSFVDGLEKENSTYYHKMMRVFQAAARENKELKLSFS